MEYRLRLRMISNCKLRSLGRGRITGITILKSKIRVIVVVQAMFLILRLITIKTMKILNAMNQICQKNANGTYIHPKYLRRTRHPEAMFLVKVHHVKVPIKIL